MKKQPLRSNTFQNQPIAKLDLTDKKILKALMRNGRAHISEISKKTGIQRDVIAYRLDKLEKKGVIRFFTPVLNPGVMGHPIYTWMNIILADFDVTFQKEFVGYCMEHTHIVYVSKVTGKYHYMIAISARDLLHYDKIIGDLLSKFSHMIKDYDTSSIIEEYKYDEMVELIDA